MATHFSIFAQKILWTEEPGGLQFVESQRVGHNQVCVCARTHTHTHTVDLQCVSFRSTAEWFSYVYTVYLFLSRFFSHIGYNRILSQVPSTIQQVLVFYLFYIQQCVYINPQLLIYSSRRDLPSGSVVKKLPTVQEMQVRLQESDTTQRLNNRNHHLSTAF